MCKDKGYALIHRSVWEWEWHDDVPTNYTWIYLFTNANYADKKWHGVDIKRGQILTSLSTISKDTGLSIQQVRTALSKLVSSDNISILPTNKFSLITICKYDSYQTTPQIEQQTSNTQPTHTQHTTNTQSTTTKESNKDNTSKKEIISTSVDKSKMISDSDSDIIDVECDETSDVFEVKMCEADKIPQDCDIDYDGIVTFFNAETRGVFGNIRAPLSDKRKKMIRARIKEYGKKTFAQAIKMAYESDFLKGQNNRGFCATFDWIILPTNFEKIISGNYGINNTQRVSTIEQINADTRNRVAELFTSGC